MWCCGDYGWVVVGVLGGDFYYFVGGVVELG